ncbi:hypothetical protein Bca52824_044541 [Brassica carinata]|uniref:Uncharacterized protein n=1 Tax=Brassica carinata TaxID=52824 RepID=A0A8X7RC31_BRACI|nr:hypothetical protein Bca52824_044541 [Brassica carinata]
MHPVSSSSSSSSSSPATNDISTPLLNRNRPRSSQPLRGAASRLLRRASSRGMMLRESSVRVRETAAEQIEERQSRRRILVFLSDSGSLCIIFSVCFMLRVWSLSIAVDMVMIV